MSVSDATSATAKRRCVAGSRRANAVGRRFEPVADIGVRAIRIARENARMPRRSHGTGHLYEKHGSYYGRWRTVDGRWLNRKVGRVRTPGQRDGLTRSQAERAFRRLQDKEERTPARRHD